MKISLYVKAVFAALLAGLGSLATALSIPGVTGVNLREWVTIAIAALLAGGTVANVTNGGTYVPFTETLTPEPQRDTKPNQNVQMLTGPKPTFNELAKPVSIDNVPTGLGGTPVTEAPVVPAAPAGA